MKFRLWCCNKKEWERSPWAIMPDGKVIDFLHGFMELEPETHILEKSTGVFDKNNQEIFEGDILEIIELSNEKLVEYETPVIYEDCSFLVRQGGLDYDTYLGSWSGDPNNTYPTFELKIVGNIHEGTNNVAKN